MFPDEKEQIGSGSAEGTMCTYRTSGSLDGTQLAHRTSGDDDLAPRSQHTSTVPDKLDLQQECEQLLTGTRLNQILP